jgi:hypothetical protein
VEAGPDRRARPPDPNACTHDPRDSTADPRTRTACSTTCAFCKVGDESLAAWVDSRALDTNRGEGREVANPCESRSVRCTARAVAGSFPARSCRS